MQLHAVRKGRNRDLLLPYRREQNRRRLAPLLRALLRHHQSHLRFPPRPLRLPTPKRVKAHRLRAEHRNNRRKKSSRLQDVASGSVSTVLARKTKIDPSGSTPKSLLRRHNRIMPLSLSLRAIVVLRADRLLRRAIRRRLRGWCPTSSHLRRRRKTHPRPSIPRQLRRCLRLALSPRTGISRILNGKLRKSPFGQEQAQAQVRRSPADTITRSRSVGQSSRLSHPALLRRESIRTRRRIARFTATRLTRPVRRRHLRLGIPNRRGRPMRAGQNRRPCLVPRRAAGWSRRLLRRRGRRSTRGGGEGRARLRPRLCRLGSSSRTSRAG